MSRWSRPGVGDEHDVGLRCRVQGREQSARARSQHVLHRLGAPGHRLQPASAQRLDRALTAGRGEVAALGEDHEGVVVVEVAGEGGDVVLEVGAGRRGRREEAGRHPVEQHVDQRVPGQGVLEHHAWLAVVPVHQRVEQHQRVPRPGVPAGDQEREARVGVRLRAVGDHAQVEHAAGLGEQDPGHALHEVVVQALEVRGAQAAAAAAGQPVAQQDREAERLQAQVDHREPEQAQRPPPPGQHRGEHGGQQQPQRQRGPHHEGQRDDQRRHDGAAHGPGPALGGSRAAHVCSSR